MPLESQGAWVPFRKPEIAKVLSSRRPTVTNLTAINERGSKKKKIRKKNKEKMEKERAEKKKKNGRRSEKEKQRNVNRNDKPQHPTKPPQKIPELEAQKGDLLAHM